MAIRYRTPEATTWIETATRNIGVGGAFLEGPAPPVGTTITLELELPTSDHVFTLPAVVRWAAAEGGAGVQFKDVDVDILLELNDYFASLTAS
ncbi:hypothetical protein BH11MYX1_BH11MYX1_01620 [soil metagenome]